MTLHEFGVTCAAVFLGFILGKIISVGLNKIGLVVAAGNPAVGSSTSTVIGAKPATVMPVGAQ